MAVGVPEHEVFAAADRVLARGERPTVERVRSELGRGSPARVGSLLESWWEALAQRLAGETRLPDLPAPVAEAFRAVWASATAHGTELAQAAIADTAAQLAVERGQLAADRDGWQAAVATARAAERELRQSAAALEARLADRQQLLEQQAQQLADLTAQRDALTARVAQLDDAARTLRDRLDAQEAATAIERDAQAQHIRAVEDRAHAEVDRAREEAKAARRDLAAQARTHAAAQRVRGQALEAAQAAVTDARREAAREQARAQALEQQLARLAELPATLEATFSRATASRASRSKSAAARPRSRTKARKD